ncbi:MAG TPA: polyphosphate kinase 2 family protein [Vicinamibacterales bacterium]|jgi:PPK2 family polyphosphate:nucleotide phosphotransferase
MKLDAIIARSRKFVQPYRVTNGKHFSLTRFAPDDIGPFKKHGKDEAAALLDEGVEALSALQELLYASDTWSVLLVFQAMDAAGKDSAIKHVMSGVNPQGCQVFSFKAPSSEELDHDFLWRCAKRLPERGRIGIFNRSYYEELLVVRVHKELLQRQHLPQRLVTEHIWKQRFQDVAGFERHLARSGVLVLKFFLNVSKEEQKKRFLERLDRPEKNWKFSDADLRERARWSSYMKAYQEAISHTAARHAPWFVVPADHKWFTRLIVAAAIIDAMGSLGLAYPTLGRSQTQMLAKAKRDLQNG